MLSALRLTFNMLCWALSDWIHRDGEPWQSRAAIDMKHIKQDFNLKAWVRAPGVDLGGGAEAKIKLFQNMVMLHSKLKLTTFAATW